MLKAGLKRIVSMNLPPISWMLLFLPDILLAAPYAIWGDMLVQAWPFRIIVLVLNCITLVALFKATRRLGGALATERGSFAAWFGWSLIVYLPAFIIAVSLALVISNSGDPRAAKVAIPPGSAATIMALTLIPMAPFVLHSVGRAIAATAQPLGWSRAICAHRFPRVGLAIAAAYALPHLAGDFLLVIGQRAQSFAIPAAALSAVLFNFGLLWSAAIAARSWRSVGDSSS